MDTFEKLGWVAGEWRIGRYDWAKTISETKGSLWIVAGRCRLAWKNVVRFPVQLEPMSSSEADDLLVKCGVSDSELRSLAVEKARGIPVYLIMLADMINRSSVAEARRDLLCIVDYDNLVEVYLRGLDASLKPAIYTAAFIEYWDYEFMMAVGESSLILMLLLNLKIFPLYGSGKIALKCMRLSPISFVDLLRALSY